jgi:hypothetical protein
MSIINAASSIQFLTYEQVGFKKSETSFIALNSLLIFWHHNFDLCRNFNLKKQLWDLTLVQLIASPSPSTNSTQDSLKQIIPLLVLHINILS